AEALPSRIIDHLADDAAVRRGARIDPRGQRERVVNVQFRFNTRIEIACAVKGRRSAWVPCHKRYAASHGSAFFFSFKLKRGQRISRGRAELLALAGKGLLPMALRALNTFFVSPQRRLHAIHSLI